jgi:uncharacterized small protein (DUF1192 family)
MFDDDGRPRKKTVHELGQDLSPLSIADLEARIEQLNAEIVRLVEARAAKIATQAAADAFFKL